MRTVLLLLAALSAARADDLQTAVVALELERGQDPDLLQRAARAQDPATRRLAARASGRLKRERALNWLLPLLHDRDAQVRRAALFALGQIGGGSALIGLRSALATMPAQDLPRALEALGKTRDPRAVAFVVPYLSHASPHLRGAAALALFRLQDRSALTELFAALRSETQAEPRWRIIYAAYRLLRERQRRTKTRIRAHPQWARLLDASSRADRPFHERVFAILARGNLAGALGRLGPLLSDPDPRIVVAAIRALREPWGLPAAGVVSGSLEHGDALIREEALRMLAAGGQQAADLLEVVLPKLSSSPRLNLIAREALAKAGRSVAVAADDEELAWRVNAFFPDRLPATPPLSLRGRIAAAEVCGEQRIPKTTALEVLSALLSVKDFTVRATAIASLAKRGAKSRVAAIVAAAEDSPGTTNLDVRLEAARALATLETYDTWLERAATDPDRPVRDAARETLKGLGRVPPPAREPASFRLHGRDTAAILEAARALRGARVTLETNRGPIVMRLLPDEAPVHCVNFATLVERGFYDHKTWHRVVADFVIQGGCPRGDGWGGPGYLVPDEIGTRPYRRGTVGMPKSGDDTGGCQIFVTHLPTPHLDGRYSVYAQVVEGLDVLDRIRVGDRILRATLQRAASTR